MMIEMAENWAVSDFFYFPRPDNFSKFFKSQFSLTGGN